MYRESSSVQKYRAQKDSRRGDSNTSLIKEKHKLLNTTNPNFHYERQPTLSPSQKAANARPSVNYQNILTQIQPSSTKNSKTPLQLKQQAIQNKKNDLLKQYLKNTIGAKKPIAKYENKENRDYSNANKTLDKENETPLDKSKYQSKIEAYMQTVKNLRPQSAGKNVQISKIPNPQQATPKAGTMTSFMSPKNVLNYTVNPTPKAGKTQVFAVKDMNVLNNTAMNTTVFRYPESRDGSFVQPAQRGKSTDPTAAKYEESRRPSSNKMLIDLDESMGYSPSKNPNRAMTTTNSRVKEEFKNMLNVNVNTTKHDSQSKAKYFKFNDFSNDIGVFEADFSPISKDKKDTTLTEALNSSTNNVKDSLMRISKNLANQPYPTLIKQINLASNTPTNSAKPPLYNFAQQETPTSKHFPQDAPIKKPLDYYQNKVLAIQTTKENKKIEFPSYLQNYTYDRSKSKKDLSFNLEAYNQERDSKIQKYSIEVAAITDPNRKARSSSEHHHEFAENMSKKILDQSLVSEKNEAKNRYSVGNIAFQSEVPQSKTPKGGSYAENHLRNMMNTQPTGIKQIDTNIKTITELFKATTPTTVHPPSNISAIAERYLKEDKENDNRDRVNQIVQSKPLQDPKSELKGQDHNESTILEEEPESREKKIRAFREEYVVGKQIGQGAYASVRLAIHKPTNRKVAIKIYEKQKIMEPMRKKSVRREIKLMQKIDNIHVIKIIDTIESNNHVNIIMEYVGGMSLHGYLKSQPNRRLKEENAFKIFKQITLGLHYCHVRCIAHRDIKLENILLDHNGNVKIIDFGFSTLIPNDKKVKMFCGTPSYMAPEIVQKLEYCGPPADVWALGVLLYALLCGAFPFKGDSDKELYRKIIKGEFIIPDHVSDNAACLIRKMITVQPEKRPTTKEIMNDPWFIMHSFLEKKMEKEISSHRKSLSIDKGDDFRPNLNQPISTKDQNAPQVNNFMKPPTSNTPTGNHSKINFKEGSATKPSAKGSSPRNMNGGASTPTGISQTNNYFINNKNIIYNINFKDQKGSKGPNETDILGSDEAEEDAKRKKSLNETEIWGNNGASSTEKSYRKEAIPASRGSVGTGYTYNQINSGRKESLPSTAPSVTHYDIEIINSLVKMGYREDQINQGLKDQSNIIFTIYSRLLNDKKAIQHNHNTMFLNSLAPNKDANNSFVSPSHLALKKRFEFGNTGYTNAKNSSLLDVSGMTNKDNSVNNTSEILKASFHGKDINVSDTDIVVKLGHH